MHVVLQFSAVVIWILFEIGPHDATLAGLELCVSQDPPALPSECQHNQPSTVLTWKVLIHRVRQVCQMLADVMLKIISVGRRR